jgi:hypothetical protein
MTRHAAYALLILIAFFSSIAILQQLDEMNQPTPMWSPK